MLYNFIILITANRRLPEFAGYESRTYPGTPSPRKCKFEPKSQSLPSSFDLDWKTKRLKRHRTINFSANIRIVVSSPSPELENSNEM